MAKRSHSVADPARPFPVIQMSRAIEEQYSDEEDGRNSEEDFTSSLSSLEVSPALSGRRSPLRRQMTSIDGSHEFTRRTRIVKGRPDYLQRLDGTEWKEIGSIRMSESYVARRELQPSLQVVKVDPSSKNLSLTVESAALRARLGLTRGRVPGESSEQPSQVSG